MNGAKVLLQDHMEYLAAIRMRWYAAGLDMAMVYLPPCPLGPPRKLLFSMPTFASIFDNILVTFWPPDAPKFEPKTSQNCSQNRFQNYAKANMERNKKNMKLSAECKVLKA